LRGVEDWLGLVIARYARLTLGPSKRTSCIEREGQVLLRRAKAYSHHIGVNVGAVTRWEANVGLLQITGATDAVGDLGLDPFHPCHVFEKNLRVVDGATVEQLRAWSILVN